MACGAFGPFRRPTSGNHIPCLTLHSFLSGCSHRCLLTGTKSVTLTSSQSVTLTQFSPSSRQPMATLESSAVTSGTGLHRYTPLAWRSRGCPHSLSAAVAGEVGTFARASFLSPLAPSSTSNTHHSSSLHLTGTVWHEQEGCYASVRDCLDTWWQQSGTSPCPLLVLFPSCRVKYFLAS